MSDHHSSEDRPTVTLPQGTVVGIKQRGEHPKTVESFLGIPYALPPTGDLRFRPPVKVPSSTKTIDACRYGPRAPAKQFLIIGPELEESEDCLTVNVFRPEGVSSSDNLPVAIYFHGGAFNRGNAAMYNSTSVVGWSAEPFVCVSFGYRIGSLGFLPSGLSTKEGALNLGLKDQILLMEWVQENIGEFGGDKCNITIIGLSAGAHSIGHHLLDYEAGKTPLFHRAVMESGAPTSRAVRRPDAAIHEQQFKDFLNAVKCPKDLPESEIFPFLRSLPLETVAKAQTEVFGNYNSSLRWAFQPVIDGEIIRRRPIDAWREGKWHKVPIMTGFNTNEGSVYVNKKMSTSDEFIDFWRTLLPQLTDEDVEKINTLYPDPFVYPDSIYKEDRLQYGVGEMFKRIEAAYAHYAYVSPVRQTAHFANRHVPVYLYHWALRSSIVDGAQHGSNMKYEFQDPDTCAKSKAQDEISKSLHAYVTSFICSGDPNKVKGGDEARPEWVKHEGDKPRLIIFGRENKELVGGEVGKAAEISEDVWASEESNFWWDKVEISQQ
ncbi:acetylcholinesterase precursor [Pseudomassariella vexata]|uniref:Carboxylic ester hydrolase n=1 Tax=Pseudomassariella vexata TaxID=1141098 RepID=A0A1Y2E427_9PEZI|nr:acetylcholinesterase precursor [Pseudomassariella vexata]ORY66104.1 acetylcholinesterase precursor [Pseudomassariella vexata]